MNNEIEQNMYADEQTQLRTVSAISRFSNPDQKMHIAAVEKSKYDA